MREWESEVVEEKRSFSTLYFGVERENSVLLLYIFLTSRKILFGIQRVKVILKIIDSIKSEKSKTFLLFDFGTKSGSVKLSRKSLRLFFCSISVK